ncbi:MAG: secretin N-terminal domain-containing protein [Candidatus Methylomirabilales bacterium]
MVTNNLRAGGFSRLCLILVLGGSLLGCAAEISLQRGEDMSSAGRWEEAVQFYLDAASRDPQNVEIRLALARAMQEASQQLVRQAQELLKDNRVDEAAAAYRRALHYNSENTAAQAGLVRATVLRQVDERLARAQEQMKKGEWRAAQGEVAAALRLDPEHPRAIELRKEIALNLKAETPPKAEADEEQAAARMFSTQPVTLRFRDTDIKEALEVFARTAGVNIFTDESLPAKRITTYFKDLPLREAFNLILVSNRLFAKRVAPNTVIVVPDNPGKRQQYDDLVVQTFYLSDADAKVAVNLVRTILNTRQVFVNEKLNALVVRDTPDKVELARKLLAANDRGVGEVEIDLEVLEVDLDRMDNLGIDIQPRSLSVTLGFPASIPLTGSILSSIYHGSALSITNPSLVLNLVKNDSSTKTLASPTVRILDRQKAKLLIGQRRPFQISSLTSVPAVAGTTTTTPTGAVTTTQTNVEYRDIGLKLTLTPTINLDGEVTVELSFEISSVGAAIAGVVGGDLLPPINTRNLDTFIKVKNGETRLLGGLLQTDEFLSNSRIPFLSDIPGLGRLFVNPSREQTRTDVLISLTPRIVKVLERPEPDLETFQSGTAESFGPAVPAGAPTLSAPPTPTPAPARPSGPPSGPPGGAPPGGAQP